jgi:hypothetical protein
MTPYGLAPASFPLSAEFRLAASCALWPHSDRRVDAVRRTAAADIGWDRFLRVATHHGVEGMAYDALRRCDITVPKEPLDRLARRASGLVRRNLMMAAEALKLRTAFAAAGIPVAFLKGLPVAMLAYGTIALRPMIDLDLLVPESFAGAGAGVLAAQGYRQVSPPPDTDASQLVRWMRARKHFVHVNETRRIVVELHWRLVDNPLIQVDIPPAPSWVDVPIGSNMTLPTLASDDLLLYLAVHGAQHGWASMKWIADIAALCAADPARADRLMVEATRHGLARVAHQALLVSACLFATPAPKVESLGAGDARVVRWLTATALDAMTGGHGEIGPDDSAFGSVRVSLSRFLLKPGWRFKLAQLKSAMTTGDDWATLRLPARWRGLYVVLRLPLWLWSRVVHQGRPRKLAAK